MRLIRRLVVLAIIGGGGVAAYNSWSDQGWPLAARASATASVAASQVGVTMSESALTAKIKSKMALDDHVNARAVDVDTSGSVVTLTGVVGSAAARDRAVSLARDTAGVARVVDRLQVANPSRR
jgi:osmotically-inducible protein OsmY